MNRQWRASKCSKQAVNNFKTFPEKRLLLTTGPEFNFHYRPHILRRAIGQTNKTSLSDPFQSGPATDLCIWSRYCKYSTVDKSVALAGWIKIGKGITLILANRLKQVIMITCLSPVQTDLSPPPALLSRPICLIVFSTVYEVLFCQPSCPCITLYISYLSVLFLMPHLSTCMLAWWWRKSIPPFLPACFIKGYLSVVSLVCLSCLPITHGCCLPVLPVLPVLLSPVQQCILYSLFSF